MLSKCFSYLLYKRKYSQMFIRSFEEFENVFRSYFTKVCFKLLRFLKKLRNFFIYQKTGFIVSL